MEKQSIPSKRKKNNHNRLDHIDCSIFVCRHLLFSCWIFFLLSNWISVCVCLEKVFIFKNFREKRQKRNKIQIKHEEKHLEKKSLSLLPGNFPFPFKFLSFFFCHLCDDTHLCFCVEKKFKNISLSMKDVQKQKIHIFPYWKNDRGKNSFIFLLNFNVTWSLIF